MPHPTRYRILNAEKETLEAHKNLYRALRAFEEGFGQRTLQAYAGDWTLDLISASS